jgi:hypothetical protein
VKVEMISRDDLREKEIKTKFKSVMKRKLKWNFLFRTILQGRVMSGITSLCAYFHVVV